MSGSGGVWFGVKRIKTNRNLHGTPVWKMVTITNRYFAVILEICHQIYLKLLVHVFTPCM